LVEVLSRCAINLEHETSLTLDNQFATFFYHRIQKPKQVNLTQNKVGQKKFTRDGVIKMRQVFAKVYIKQNDLHQKLFSHNRYSIIVVADGGKSRTRYKQGGAKFLKMRRHTSANESGKFNNMLS